MKRTHRLRILISALVATAFCAPFAQKASAETNRYYAVSEVPDARFGGDVVGRAYAAAGGHLFAFGGIGANGAVVAEVLILEMQDERYVLHRAQLDAPVAFAGAVGVGGSVYLVGGLGEGSARADVLKLTWQDGVLKEQPLPPLPEPCILPGVSKHHTTTKDYLYVLGGVAAPDAAALSPAVFELPITDFDAEDSAWIRKEDMPGGGRIGAVVRETYNEVVVSGGWKLESGQLIVDSQTWGYARIARDGHVESGWEQRADQPVPVAMPAFAKTGQSHMVLAGGDAVGGTLADLLSGTKAVAPVADVMAFHDPTDTWVQIGELPEAACGGMLAGENDTDFVLTGARHAAGPASAQRLAFTRAAKPMRLLDWCIVIAYFVIVATVGGWFAKRQKSTEEYALGNRKMKWWASAISMYASGVSTISFMALPALIACIGLATTGPAIFMIIGAVIGAYVTFPLLRRLNITSTFEYLEHRYGLVLRLIGSFVGIIVQLMGRIGIVVMLPALAISSMTGLDPMVAILLTGIVTTLYSTAGGFEAVIWTDVVQGILMMTGFISLGLLAFVSVQGGPPAFLEYGRELGRFNLFITRFDLTTNMMWFAAAAYVINIMAFASDQATAQRVLSIPMKDVRKTSYLGSLFGMGSALIVGFVGISLFAFFKSEPELLTPVMKNDQIVPIFILSKVPTGFAGLLIATMFAAAMSTISTSVNSCAVMFGEDFYKRFRRAASSKEEMRVMQVASIVTGVVGTGLAMWILSRPMPTLWESFMRIMAMVGGGFIGVYALGMFTRRTHELGAIIGVAASFIMAYLVQYLPFDIHYNGLSTITVGSCLIAGYLSSLIIPWKTKPLRGLTVWDQITNEEARARIAKMEETKEAERAG